MLPEEIKDQHLRIEDMRLHSILHMSRIYEKTRNVNKDDNIRSCHKNSKYSVRKVGHYVHNGKEWIKQQGESQPLVENLHIKVDESWF